MTKIYVVMTYNYPSHVFDNLEKAIEYCKTCGDEDEYTIDEYELNGGLIRDTVWENNYD
jgi:hypothetical protein